MPSQAKAAPQRAAAQQAPGSWAASFCAGIFGDDINGSSSSSSAQLSLPSPRFTELPVSSSPASIHQLSPRPSSAQGRNSSDSSDAAADVRRQLELPEVGEASSSRSSLASQVAVLKDRQQQGYIRLRDRLKKVEGDMLKMRVDLLQLQQGPAAGSGGTADELKRLSSELAQLRAAQSALQGGLPTPETSPSLPPGFVDPLQRQNDELLRLSQDLEARNAELAASNSALYERNTALDQRNAALDSVNDQLAARHDGLVNAIDSMQKQIRSLTKRQDVLEVESKECTKVCSRIESISQAYRVTNDQHKIKGAAAREAAPKRKDATDDERMTHSARARDKHADPDPHDDSGLSLRSDASPSAAPRERPSLSAAAGVQPSPTIASGAQSVKRPLSTRPEDGGERKEEGHKRLRHDEVSLEEGEHTPERAETTQERIKRIGDAAEARAARYHYDPDRVAQETRARAEQRELGKRREDSYRPEAPGLYGDAERREVQDSRARFVKPRDPEPESREEAERREARERHQALLAAQDRRVVQPAPFGPVDRLAPFYGEVWNNSISDEWRRYDLLSSCTAHSDGQRNLKIFFDPRESYSLATQQLKDDLRVAHQATKWKSRLALEFPRYITAEGLSHGPSLRLDALVSITQGLTGRAGCPDVVLGRDFINYHGLIFIRLDCDTGRFASPRRSDLEIPLRLHSY